MTQPKDYSCITRPIPGTSQWVCEYAELPGCRAIAPSRLDAMIAGEEALEKFLSEAEGLGIELPTPGAANESPGNIRFRTRRSLHRDLVLYAASLKLSLNEFCKELLIAAVARMYKLPTPSTLILMERVPVDEARYDRAYSGVWIQRIPPWLHFQLKTLAKIERISMNTFIAYLIVDEFTHLKLLSS